MKKMKEVLAYLKPFRFPIRTYYLLHSYPLSAEKLIFWLQVFDLVLESD